MTPWLATVFCCVAILALNTLDRYPSVRTSAGVWLAVVWVSLGAIPAMSSWLGLGAQTASTDLLLEGSPFDRAVISSVLACGLVVLLRRIPQVKALMVANPALVVFFVYCGLSSLWSDYPFVAFKRWTKALGNVVMIFLVVTESNPSIALRRLLARVGFLLIPLSVLTIKYFPESGRGYDQWTGTPFYQGLGGGKNGLGSICLVFGLAALWNLLGRLKERAVGPSLVHGTVLIKALRHMRMADSATSLACFALGGSILIALTLPKQHRTRRLHAVVGIVAVMAAFGFVFGDLYSHVVGALGRNITLTGRTELWTELLTLSKEPWFGTGFETFFLGPRLDYLWNRYWWQPNEAHNGYIEVYLTLGWIGLGLLALVMAAGYRNIVAAYRQDPALGALQLVFFVVSTVYNYTESGFKVMHPVWIAFIIATVHVPATPAATNLATSLRAIAARPRVRRSRGPISFKGEHRLFPRTTGTSRGRRGRQCR